MVTVFRVRLESRRRRLRLRVRLNRRWHPAHDPHGPGSESCRALRPNVRREAGACRNRRQTATRIFTVLRGTECLKHAPDALPSPP